MFAPDIDGTGAGGACRSSIWVGAARAEVARNAVTAAAVEKSMIVVWGPFFFFFLAGRDN